MSKRRLGKGIDALLQGRDLEQLGNMSSVLSVAVERIQANPDQPRNRFDDESLNELADSIREKGIIQPIIAEDRGDGTYIIVAGERRYRAAKIAGLSEVPVIPHDFSPEEKLEIALVENLQREDLNPVDEALAFESAMGAGGYTQEQLAKRLGKSRSAIANAVRLLRLPADMKNALSAGELSAGHGRALLAVDDEAARRELFKRIQDDNLSVREAESVVRPTGMGAATGVSSQGAMVAGDPARANEGTDGPTEVPLVDEPDELQVPAGSGPSPELRVIEDRLVEHFGTKVTLKGNDDSGRIEISYFSRDDLDRVLESLGLSLG